MEIFFKRSEENLREKKITFHTSHCPFGVSEKQNLNQNLNSDGFVDQ